MPEASGLVGPCTICNPADSEDYVIRTFDLYIAEPGGPFVSVGAIRVGTIMDEVATHDAFGLPVGDRSPRLFAFRDRVNIEATIDSITYENIARVVAEDPINIPSGWQIPLTWGGLRPVYRVYMEYTFPNGTTQIIMYLFRACIESKMDVEFGDDWSMIPVVIRAMPSMHFPDYPFGYIRFGDNVGLS